MKKHIYKLLVPIFALISMVCLVLGLTACNNGDESHEHTYGNWEITAPTADVTGSAIKTCTTCKEGEDGHYVIVTLPVLSDSNYNKSNDTATCTEGGTAEYSITIQGETFTFTAETSEKGHTFDTSKWEKDESGHWHAATCEHTALTDSFAEHFDNNNDFECDVCGYPLDGAHVHSYGNWQITKPTDTNVGSAVKICSTCEEDEEGHTITVTLPVLGDENYIKSADSATCEAGGEITYSISVDNETISFVIETSAKGHSFDEDFWLGDGFTHWHSSTCGHDIKGDEAPCIDENGDFICDVCGYPIHQHSYVWNGNDTEHWLEPTCGDTTEIKDKEPHIDVDNDDMCDTCGRLLPHTHKYSEKWTYDENSHWHAPICTDTTVGADEAVHTFKNGVCECGAIEAETNAYKILIEKTDLQDEFVEWLNAIKATGVTNVTATESGDVIYVYGDGTTEAAYVAERTVKVKAATSSGDGVAHVWVMVSLFEDFAYQEVNGSYALGMAETDENGVAEIAFTPVSGYTSNNVSYRVRLAEQKDIAAYLGISEESAPKPIPNRYSASGSSDNFIAVEVSENATSDDITGQFSFSFSKGWNAYETFTLPYARYFEDPMDEESAVKEVNSTFEFSTSGSDLFDYFYFVPSNNYSFASADSTYTPDQLAVIEKNFALAASGIYKIYFTVEGNANVTLYYWNEGGVNMGAYHVTKADGTPSDDYITSISGGTAGSGKYTGGNYVEVVIEPENGLRSFQFGLICDTVCKVTITVERVGDYEVDDTVYELKIGSTSNITLAAYGSVTPFTLVDVPEGLYSLMLLPSSSSVTNQAGLISAYTTEKSKSCLWLNGIYSGIIRISAGDKKLYIVNESVEIVVTIRLETYEIPTLKADETAFLPASSSNTAVTGEPFEIPLDQSVTSGTYLAEITFFGNKVTGSGYTASLIVGNVEYKLTRDSKTTIYSAYIQITANDTIKILNSTSFYSSIIAQVKLISFPNVNQGEEISASFNELTRFYSFTATQGGTYRLTITQTNEPEYLNDLFGYIALNVLNITNVFKDEVIKVGSQFGTTDPNDIPTEISITFTLEENESMLLCFKNVFPEFHIDINFKIEYVNN